MIKYFTRFEFPFSSQEHKDFFNAAVHEIGAAWPGTIVTIYLLSATPEGRERFWSTVDPDGVLANDQWDEWMSDEARRCVALAVNLAYGDTYPVIGPRDLLTSPLASVYEAAIHYWYGNRREIG